jgi:hypothetical protein
MDVIMDVIMVYNSVIMGIKDTLFTFITFVIMVYNGVIMESRFADDDATSGIVTGCMYEVHTSMY